MTKTFKKNQKTGQLPPKKKKKKKNMETYSISCAN